jgi:hypothetical protein
MTRDVAQTDRLPNGPVAAAVLSGSIGAAVLGVVTTMAEVSSRMSTAFNWISPVGPLSGKVGVTVLLYLLSWLVLYGAWRTKNVNVTRVALVSFVLLGVGLLGTFPPFFELIAGH